MKLEEENRKQEMKTQMTVRKEEAEKPSNKDEPEKGSEGLEGSQLNIREVDQEETSTGYFDCLKEKDEENSDLILINQEFKLPEETKGGDILVDQVYVDMGLWNTMEKTESAQELAVLDKSLSDTETLKRQIRMKEDEKHSTQATQHSKTKGIKSSVKRLKKVVQINNVSMLFLAEPIVDKGKIQDYRCKLGYDHCHANRNGKLWASGTLIWSARRDLWNDLAQFADKLDMPWLIGGDFNAILN
ncbi:Uncharacterized protein Adt_21208 [Abeliophyllum distichum]|uniref:Uncharacterized protein n=1 Tax=Abeliophyllum distichum TaxID=126358 RepID=A0ABD1SYQ2_9LAMI